jgi:hypothetical protein
MDCRLCHHSNNKCSNDGGSNNGGSNVTGKMVECHLTAMNATLLLMTMMTADVPVPVAQLFSRVGLPCSLFGEEEQIGQQQPPPPLPGQQLQLQPKKASPLLDLPLLDDSSLDDSPSLDFAVTQFVDWPCLIRQFVCNEPLIHSRHHSRQANEPFEPFACTKHEPFAYTSILHSSRIAAICLAVSCCSSHHLCHLIAAIPSSIPSLVAFCLAELPPLVLPLIAVHLAIAVVLSS